MFEADDDMFEMDNDKVRVTLSGADRVAIRIGLTIYQNQLISETNHPDFEGSVADVEHVTELLERLGEETPWL